MTMLSLGSMFVIAIVVFSIQSSISESKMSRNYLNRPDVKKRPFCNAFTGCGRKRSDLSPNALHNSKLTAEFAQPYDVGQFDDESISSILDLSAEPAVEDLTRQIMSEAKLWEAIQEANQELLRHKQQSAEMGNNMAGQRVNSKCGTGLSSCFV